MWAVFDKDSFPDSYFNQAIKMANEHGIKVAWSNEAFELWYLPHFQYRNTAMARHEYQSSISSGVNKHLGGKYSYKKNDADNYRLVNQYGSQEQAIKWAAQLEKSYSDTRYAHHNPCTTVYKLVRELIGQDETLNKEIAETYSKE